MAKTYRFITEGGDVDMQCVTDGMLNHKQFFVTDKIGEDSADILAGVDTEIKEYHEEQLKAIAKDNALTLETWNDGTLVSTVYGGAEFLTYTLAAQTGAATIDFQNKTVAIEVANGTTVTALVATFTLSTDATAAVGVTAQVSGTTANNFTSPVVYTITSDLGTEVEWTVTVTVAEA